MDWMVYLAKVQGWGLRILESKQFKDLVKMSERAIQRSETWARGWFLRGLRLDLFLQEQGWDLLLNSLTEEQIGKLRVRLEREVHTPELNSPRLVNSPVERSRSESPPDSFQKQSRSGSPSTDRSQRISRSMSPSPPTDRTRE